MFKVFHVEGRGPTGTEDLNNGILCGIPVPCELEAPSQPPNPSPLTQSAVLQQVKLQNGEDGLKVVAL